MGEVIGYWYGGYRHGSYMVSLDKGILSVKHKFVENAQRESLEFKRAFGKRYFGDAEFLTGVNPEYVGGILFECDGKSEDEIKKIAQRYIDIRMESRTSDYRKKVEWGKLREKFDGVVIGIDSRIDVYDSGFSVRVVFSSDVNFGGRKKFLNENKVEFVKWVMHEVAKRKTMIRRIGDMRFYRPVEIVNLRAHEVEVKFEIKEVA